MLAAAEEVEEQRGAQPVSDPVDTTECRAALHRILQSRHFLKAPLLSAFLLHICERTLSTPGERITEAELGIRVFRRRAGFDPRQDNIVRTYARQLRKRLEEYYVTEGAHEMLCILLPRGGYTPLFAQRPVEPSSDRPEHPPALEEISAEAGDAPRRISALWLCAGALLFSLALLCIMWRMSRPRNINRDTALHRFWSQLFSSGRNTLIIPGDIGFVILQQANHKTFTLAEYLAWQAENHQYDNLALAYLRDQSYTSMLNLTAVSEIQQLPEIVPGRFQIQAPRLLRLEELLASNAILLGSNFSNPWVDIFSSQLNFHFSNHPETDTAWIVNDHPRPGEHPVYGDNTHTYRHQTYGVLAFLPNQGNVGHVLLVQGLDAAGTQAALHLLLQQTETIEAALAEARRSDGSLSSFELLIEATSLGYDSRAIDCHIVSKRIYQ